MKKIREILRNDYQINISIPTLKRRASEFGIKSYVMKKKPKITKKVAELRLKFAKKYKN